MNVNNAIRKYPTRENNHAGVFTFKEWYGELVNNFEPYWSEGDFVVGVWVQYGESVEALRTVATFKDEHEAIALLESIRVRNLPAVDSTYTYTCTDAERAKTNRRIAESNYSAQKSFTSSHITDYIGHKLPSTITRRITYHTKYELMMHVVENVEKDNFGFKICRKVVEVYIDDTKQTIVRVKASSKKASLWWAIVEFLNWLDNQPDEAKTK